MDASFVILGLVSGVIAGIFGVGGGVVLVPSLLFLGYDMQYAIGISIMQMIFSSSFGSLVNLIRGKIDLKAGSLLSIGGLIGAAFSGQIVASVDSRILLSLFVLLTFFSFKKYVFNTTTKANPNPPINSYKSKNLVIIAIGAVTGIFAISLGIGGGLIIGSLCAYLLGFDSKKVAPLALFFIIFAAISGSISLYGEGLVDVKNGLITGVSALVGVGIGLFIIEKISLSFHRKAMITLYALSLVTSALKLFSLFIKG